MEDFFPNQQDVTNLDVSDFSSNGHLSSKTFKNKKCLIFLYSPHCGYCHQTQPDILFLAKMIDPDYCSFLAIDCQKEEELVSILTANGMDIQGFPTIFLFQNGKYKKSFEEQRSRENLYHFITD